MNHVEFVAANSTKFSGKVFVGPALQRTGASASRGKRLIVGSSFNRIVNNPGASCRVVGMETLAFCPLGIKT